MDNILKVLYDHFYRAPKNMPEARRIEANHRLLIQRLSKRNRKLVLQIMDGKDLICSDVSLDIFIQGFRLAWQISNQIQNFDGRSDCSQRAEPDARFVFSKEVSK